MCRARAHIEIGVSLGHPAEFQERSHGLVVKEQEVRQESIHLQAAVGAAD